MNYFASRTKYKDEPYNMNDEDFGNLYTKKALCYEKNDQTYQDDGQQDDVLPDDGQQDDGQQDFIPSCRMFNNYSLDLR